MVPTGRGKSTARIGCATKISTDASKLSASRSGCATGTPGWCGGELLRLLHDVELRLRNSTRLFLPAKIVRLGGPFETQSPQAQPCVWGLDLSGANCKPFGGSRRGGEHRLKSVPLQKKLDVV
jgi:hypothetical protein